jgi:hypothetical protein
LRLSYPVFQQGIALCQINQGARRGIALLFLVGDASLMDDAPQGIALASMIGGNQTCHRTYQY